ncbi:MAG: thioredoxin family protein [Bacteroidetes bacterium]|nr:thioredoxin family protein [Bacteroidota bacterium]
MNKKEPITIEIFYTLTCPNCKILKRMLDDVLPQFGKKFLLKKTHANMPIGMIRTMKLGIHSVPALLIDNELVFRSVPTKEELINKLSSY